METRWPALSGRPRRLTAALAIGAAALLPAGGAAADDGEVVEVAVEDRLEAARSCVADLTAAGEWEADSPHAVEWVSRERWCREPRGAGENSSTLPCDPGASDLLALRLELDREDLAIVDRLALNLALDSAGEAWDVQFYGTANRLEPGSTLGEDSYSLATISVTRQGPDGEAEILSLTRFSFQVGDRVVMGRGEYLPPEALRARFETPETLRDACFAQLDDLEAQVTGLLDRRLLSICPEPDAPSRYQCGPMADGEGHAMVDTCVRRGLTDHEIAETRARLHTEIEAQRVRVSREYWAIHHAVTSAMANDACWLLPEP